MEKGGKKRERVRELQWCYETGRRYNVKTYNTTEGRRLLTSSTRESCVKSNWVYSPYRDALFIRKANSTSVTFYICSVPILLLLLLVVGMHFYALCVHCLPLNHCYWHQPKGTNNHLTTPQWHQLSASDYWLVFYVCYSCKSKKYSEMKKYKGQDRDVTWIDTQFILCFFSFFPFPFYPLFFFYSFLPSPKFCLWQQLLNVDKKVYKDILCNKCNRTKYCESSNCQWLVNFSKLIIF